MLGKSVDEYCAWIQSDDSWGGAIELSILSNHFNVCINAVDVKTCRIDRYPANGNFENRSVFVLYDGIHYDPLYLDTFSSKFTCFNFSGQDLLFTEKIKTSMVEVARILQAARSYTDTSNFKLLCGNCGTRLVSEVEAVQHAKSTGHSNFQEIT